MKILLVFPRMLHGATNYKDKGNWTSIILGYPIITLPYIAAITPKQYDVSIVNENYDEINFDEDVDIVGITCYTMTAPRAYEIADKFRKNGKKVVLGGYHPTALPEEAIQHADSVILSEAEITWPKLLKDAEKNKLKKFYGPNPNFDMVDIPHIRRDLIRHNPFLGAVQTTRGCHNRCEFCAISSFCKHGIKQRPIKNVVDEIKQMPNRLFIFHDPHITAVPKYARSLFKEMIKQKIKKRWVANGTSNILNKIDDEFLELARKAGCVEWFIGIESFSQEALNNIKKTVNKVEDFKKLIKRIYEHGMTVQAGVIFGFDEDTNETFDSTIEKINEFEIDVLEVNILTPFPGTPLFERLDREGRIFTKDWSKYNQVEVVFHPKNMTAEELYNGARKVAKEFYSYPKIIKRSLKILKTAGPIGGLMPTVTNLNFTKYYKRDFKF